MGFTMTEQLRQKKETFQLAIIFVGISTLISIVLEFGDPTSTTTIIFRALVGWIGFMAAWAVYMHRSKKVVSREDLILDMGCIESFPVAFTLGLVSEYRYENCNDKTRQEKREASIIEEAALCEMRRADHPAFADDYKALREAYNSNQFHKAMRYASMKWLKAILLVARSREDLVADRLLFEHFGIKRRYTKRGRRCSK